MTKARNSIRTFALVCVALTSAFLIGLSIWLTQIIASPDWCKRAIGAATEGAAGSQRQEFAVSGCFSLLRRQVDSLALNSHIAIGILALCLGVLMVIVVAGGRLSFRGSKDGVEMEVESDRVEAAARVAHAADDEAREIAEEG